MKRITGITVCLLGFMMFVAPLQVQGSGPEGVIYSCGNDRDRDCEHLVDSNLLVCPVPCGPDAIKGEFHSFASSLDGVKREVGGRYRVLEDSETDWTLDAPQVFERGPAERPGSAWSRSPAERYLDSMGGKGATLR